MAMLRMSVRRIIRVPSSREGPTLGEFGRNMLFSAKRGWGTIANGVAVCEACFVRASCVFWAAFDRLHCGARMPSVDGATTSGEGAGSEVAEFSFI